jgi:GTP-binding protein
MTQDSASFVDEVTIWAIAGDGGDGCIAFRREPYNPRGGPAGGDGGDGGNVFLRADPSVSTLLDLRDHPHVRAQRGAHGSGNVRHGATGKDRSVLVPEGTVVFDEKGTLLADLAAGGQEVVAAHGGRGGLGNARFASPVRRAPTLSEKGEPGEQRRLRLELRLLADVGLVGLPNAGKSTLIARISAARPKIADYPFTSLTPNLGVVRVDDESFVVADIPGLVAGAHEGKGLGHRFLRHVRRAALLVFMIDLAAEDRDPASDYSVLWRELEAFDPQLAERPHIVIATKVDAMRDRLQPITETVPGVLPISAVTGEGIDQLLVRLRELVVEERTKSEKATGYVRHVTRARPLSVSREDGAWRVEGSAAERAVAVTDMENDEAVTRLQRRLIKLGVERALDDAGARAGDEVRIGEISFDYEPEG